MQADVIGAKIGKEIKPKWGRSCGDGLDRFAPRKPTPSTTAAGRRSIARPTTKRCSRSRAWRRRSSGPRAAGAVYWRAYAQNRLGQRAEALATLGELKSGYPSSGWAAEANALEVEIRQSSGQRVTPDSTDEDLKLLRAPGRGQQRRRERRAADRGRAEERAVAAGQGARALRARAEQQAGGPRGRHSRGAGRQQPRPAAQGGAVRRHVPLDRRHQGAERDLRVVARIRRFAGRFCAAT